jgi:antitoxin YefM
MRTLNYTTARRNLASAMDATIEDHVPTIITRGSDKAVVMLSLDDWNAWQETMYLLRSPANAERLLKATRDFDEGENLVVKESLG